MSLKGTLVVSPGSRETNVLLGSALRDIMSGTRLTKQVPKFLTRSRATKRTLGLQQLDVKDAATDLLTAPWLNTLTEKEQVHKLKELDYSICNDIVLLEALTCEKAVLFS